MENVRHKDDWAQVKTLSWCVMVTWCMMALLWFVAERSAAQRCRHHWANRTSSAIAFRRTAGDGVVTEDGRPRTKVHWFCVCTVPIVILCWPHSDRVINRTSTYSTDWISTYLVRSCSLLNRLQTGRGSCLANLHSWGFAASECDHRVEHCSFDC